MGIYDRDYYRSPRPGVSLGTPQTIVGVLVLINVVVFLADGLLTPDGHQISTTLGVKVGSLAHPWMWWQFLTYGFAHAPWPDYWHIVFNMLALWFLGRDIELTYGRKEFLRLYLVMVVVAGVVWAATTKLMGWYNGQPVDEQWAVGASGAIAGIVVLYALHFPRRTLLLFFVIPIPAWLAGVLLIVFDCIGALNPGSTHIAHSAHLAGAAFAYFYCRYGWNLGRLVDGRFSLNWLKRRPKLHLHRPESPDEEKIGDLKEEVDRILKKIHLQGESSLTRKERRTLEAASRKYQEQKRP